MRSKLVIGVLLVLTISVWVGCGGSSNTGGGTQPISVSVNPGSQQIPASGQQQFTATVHNSSNQTVTWSVTGGGSIDSTGNYTAPAAVASQTAITVTATAAADGTTKGSIAATLLPDSILITNGNINNLHPGFTQQFNAQVTNSAVKTVDWSIGAGDPGGIDANGLYTAPVSPTAGAQAHVTATLHSDTTQASTATVTLLALQSLAIKPLGPALAVLGTQPLNVIGSFSDGTNTSKYDWTPYSTWSSVDPSTASVVESAGVATVTGQKTGVTTISASYGSVSTSTVVNVTGMIMTNANLQGSYAFALTHAGARGQGFATGSFTADGNGGITAGEVDFNALQGSGNFPIDLAASSYKVYPDGRGTITIKAQGTDTFAFILANDGTPSTRGRFIVSDAGGVELGTLERQDTTVFATGISGLPYAMLLGGMDGTPCGNCAVSTDQNPLVMAGQFPAPSSNNIAGSLDANDNGAVHAGNYSATYTNPDANGRGTLQLIPPAAVVLANQPAPWNFAYYVVSANKVLLIQTDVQTANPTLVNPTYPALAGAAEAQTFTTINLVGTSYVFLLERSASSGLFGAAGQLTFAASTLSGQMDVNSAVAGTTVPYTLVSGSSYSGAGATGRGTLNMSTSPVGSSLSKAVFYLVGDGSKMYVLETDNNTTAKANAGVAELQTASSMPNGTLMFNLGELATRGDDSSFSGQFLTSTQKGIVDSNICSSGTASCVAAQASSVLTGSFVAPNGMGRGQATLSLPLQVPHTSYGFYVVRPDKMVVFGLQSNFCTPDACYQPVDGVIEVQQ